MSQIMQVERIRGTNSVALGIFDKVEASWAIINALIELQGLPKSSICVVGNSRFEQTLPQYREEPVRILWEKFRKNSSLMLLTHRTRDDGSNILLIFQKLSNYLFLDHSGGGIKLSLARELASLGNKLLCF
ncbi:MAG: hypothetical protein UX02_C0004G0080 [Candidatus Moranbacteria bacterium GW2011_GWC1_45_18]|nr:MAG: hypothetical protein UT79_C0003G0009 [Candidatus Moranbacteria bacterium GW2011_GWC2_40_12]KKT33974.1 MAG: hypothetical protein UW19_C0003G0009 [Candidatus Moranbacteria bacterium GW2011_GWF2_44_10]KKT71394.1 MAG: hypothetical protein UW66_C0034G0009 [Candidatus Moranbacteria bacterium GW2011_GWF1_44_4]KKT99360.1 MAG: hypothetical protein UX02_C0004G0080 [Candidatus Moranbacteria bacterium GW2011_GWC1_45_18]OGI23191.1 MAG: hypothetical protein A2194_03750 [Candidatus Moranbacteria bacte